MADKHWKDLWEEDAGAEYRELCALPLEELLGRVSGRKLGQHYMIWDAIAAKKDLGGAGWQLLDFLKTPSPYLQRYHCARALLALLDCREFEAADLSVDHRNPKQNLARIRTLLENALGPPPTRA